MFELCGDKELKTLLALDPGDSIAGVARKIDENRETIRRAVNGLETTGYLEYDGGLYIVDDAVREAGLVFLTAASTVSPPTISEAYVIPHFAGMDFAYTALDAVYVWTRGGYQVARTETDYPLFIAVRSEDLEAWKRFFERFEIPTARDRQPADAIAGSLQIVLDPREQIDAEMVDGRPVISCSETVAFARDHYATFESALEMLARMYDDVDAKSISHTEPVTT